MIRLYGFRDIYDDKIVPLGHLEGKERAILHKLLTISKHLDSRGKIVTNITYLTSLRRNAKKRPRADCMTWKLGARGYDYLVPTVEQLVKQKLGSGFLQRETGLSLFMIKDTDKIDIGFRIAGFHPIDILDGRDGSPMKGRRNTQVPVRWAQLLPPDEDPYL